MKRVLNQYVNIPLSLKAYTGISKLKINGEGAMRILNTDAAEVMQNAILKNGNVVKAMQAPRNGLFDHVSFTRDRGAIESNEAAYFAASSQQPRFRN